MARRLLLILSASFLLLTAACGTTDDDAKEKTSSEDKGSDTTAKDDEGDTTDTTADEGGEEGDGSNEEFCAAVDKLETLFDDLEEDDYQGFIDTIDEAEGTFNSYVKGLPKDLQDEGELLVDTVKALASELDEIKDDPDVETKAQTAFEKLDTPELEAAGDATTEYEEATCGTT